MQNRPVLTRVLIGLAVVFVLIQFVPFRAQNPPVTQGPAWDSPQTEQLARAACFDCHSNEVKTPWYGYIAPAAWVVRDHVDEARSKLNFSEMDKRQEDAHEAGEAVVEGEMPPLYYRIAHSAARLTDAQLEALSAGLDATLGSEGEGGGGEEGEVSDEGEDD